MNKNNGSFPVKKIIWVSVAAIFAIVLVLGIQWATFARPPLPEAIEALENDDQIAVTFEPWVTFSPAQTTPATGFIFYPGGRIDPRGYAPLMREIALEGYLVIVPEMPINMAPFSPNIADDIIQYFSEIDYWVIGGHSVGGTMAAQYTDKHPEIISGLAIWASYPMDSSDLSDLDIPVVSIYGSQEVRVNDQSVGARKSLLPSETQYVRIAGGDHHQFGSYVIDPEDHLATTSRESQQQQINQATLALLDEVSNKK